MSQVRAERDERQPQELLARSCVGMPQANAGKPQIVNRSTGKSDTSREILEPGFAAKPVQSGLHPDPGHSSGALLKRLLQRLKRRLRIFEIHVRRRNDESADVAILCKCQRPR